MTDDRGQAFALEGVLGAMLLFTALLFSMQAVILTPTTAGTVDQDVKSQLRSTAHDNLVVAGENGELEHLARYWNNGSGRFAHAYDTAVGYGWEAPCSLGPSGDSPACEAFGERLNETLSGRGFTYNLVLDYRSKDLQQTNSTRVVYRGVPSSNAVTATYTVILYDDMTLTSPAGADGPPLIGRGANEFYASDIDPGPVYNVVEVRLVVW